MSLHPLASETLMLLQRLSRREQNLACQDLILTTKTIALHPKTLRMSLHLFPGIESNLKR